MYADIKKNTKMKLINYYICISLSLSLFKDNFSLVRRLMENHNLEMCAKFKTNIAHVFHVFWIYLYIGSDLNMQVSSNTYSHPSCSFKMVNVQCKVPFIYRRFLVKYWIRNMYHRSNNGTRNTINLTNCKYDHVKYNHIMNSYYRLSSFPDFLTEWSLLCIE